MKTYTEIKAYTRKIGCKGIQKHRLFLPGVEASIAKKQILDSENMIAKNFEKRPSAILIALPIICWNVRTWRWSRWWRIAEIWTWCRAGIKKNALGFRFRKYLRSCSLFSSQYKCPDRLFRYSQTQCTHWNCQWQLIRERKHPATVIHCRTDSPLTKGAHLHSDEKKRKSSWYNYNRVTMKGHDAGNGMFTHIIVTCL